MQSTIFDLQLKSEYFQKHQFLWGSFLKRWGEGGEILAGSTKLCFFLFYGDVEEIAFVADRQLSAHQYRYSHNGGSPLPHYY
jgi:hypothetical protein